MKVPVRTLLKRDVEVLARDSVTATVSKGYVERHGLRWYSHALREWELRRHNLRASREVELLIDELDLSAVFVVLPSEGGNPDTKIKAASTKPTYTQQLSLYEHQKLKEKLKLAHQQCRLERIADEELYRMRQEYYVLLGRQGDPISKRRLEKLRDELTAKRASSITADEPGDQPATDGEQSETATAPSATTSGETSSVCVDQKVPKPRTNKPKAMPESQAEPSATLPSPQDVEPPPVGNGNDGPAATSPTQPKRTPTYKSTYIRRTHK